ncbi:carnitine O-palmitoyltransferase 2, mitochondrial-like [Planococcus citri]|uniref:carnitine O-palmitoyltransferase 2, mitochondrial-like n=1 Tax=Planococcus citri TaxID=170843 RepID=UPI0031FA3A83
MLKFKRTIDVKILRISRISSRTKYSSTDDYQFIQRSIVPTLHFQQSLPRLPIPELPKTCDRYLQSLKPILTQDEFNNTESIVKKFQTEVGAQLHKELKDQDAENKDTSYISEPWFHMYLCDRTPLPINYNPALIFVNQGSSFYDKQLIKTSNLIISSLRFYKSLKDNILEPEVFHLNPKKSDTLMFRRITSMLPSAISWYGAYLFNAYPLDMVQYSHLFGSTRIPEPGKDRLFHRDHRKHIVVLRRGHFYSVDVLDDSGHILSPEVILTSINAILSDDSAPAEHPLGILTSTERNKWAETRKHLENIGNAASLNVIDTSLFAVALDEPISEIPKDICKWFLHSDGINRWFDKSFTLICTGNGIAGLNFEHSWGDGVAVLRYFQDIHKDTKDKPKVTEITETVSLPSESHSPRKLNFVIDDRIKREVDLAKFSYKKVCDSLDLNDVIYDIGKSQCKKFKVSPDAIMQLSFQLAYYNYARKTVATYESCSTAAFKHGRTETIRPCTMETKKFCEAVTAKSLSNEELRKIIDECSKAHGNLVKNAAMGQGFDRHLFALRKLAEKKSSTLPSIFTDLSYQKINQNILSTSTLSSEVVLGGGFGPVVQDGFGIAYMIRDDSCGAVVTNYKDQTDGSKFKSCLEDGFKTIQSVLKNS